MGCTADRATAGDPAGDVLAPLRNLRSNTGMDARPIFASFDPVPSAKGASIHIEAVARTLADHLGELDLVTLAGPDPAARFEHPGITHHHMPAQGDNLLARVMDFRMALGRWWGMRCPRVCHIRSIWEGYPIAPHRGHAFQRLVYEVNGLPSIELKYHHPDVADDAELLTKLRHQEDRVLAAADRVLTVSQVNADNLVRRGVATERISVIPNGVDLGRFRWQAPDASRMVDPAQPLRLLYVGTLASWQGVHIAIEALALWLRDRPATLTIIGPARGRQRRDLHDYAAKLKLGDALIIADETDQTGVVDALHTHDVALVPLLANDRNLVQGCSPLKLIEALAAGTPVVASDLPVVRELATETEAILVKPGSAKSLKDGLLQLVSDEAAITARSKAGRARAESLGWDAHARALREVYDEVLAMPSSTAANS